MIKNLIIGIGAGIIVGSVCEVIDILQHNKKEKQYLDLLASDAVRQLKCREEVVAYGIRR